MRGGPCMCGDICCPSCGPAQGNSRCPKCGAWDSEGTCRCLPTALIDRLIEEMKEEKEHEDITTD